MNRSNHLTPILHSFFSIHPSQLTQFPNNLWLYLYQVIYPVAFATFLPSLFMIKNEALRKEIHNLLTRGNLFHCETEMNS